MRADSTAAALISREFISDIKKTAIRPNRDAACQEALATLTAFDGLLFE